jgi:aspartate ammonia-lyase
VKNSTMSTNFEATERVLAEVRRAVEALISIKKTDVNANGVFIQPHQKLVALKAACEQHIDRAIEAIESKWPQ